MLKLTCVSMIRTGSSAGKKKRKYKVDNGCPNYSPPELPAFRFNETMQLFNIDIDLSKRDAWYVSATSGGIPIHTGVAPTVDSRLRTFGELGP